jgi:hypothetical protein
MLALVGRAMTLRAMPAPIQEPVHRAFRCRHPPDEGQGREQAEQPAPAAGHDERPSQCIESFLIHGESTSLRYAKSGDGGSTPGRRRVANVK